MANGHGGDRPPAKPAPASGPGRLSQRTDGQPGQKMADYTGGSYGSGVAMDAQQRGAAMSNTAAQAPQGQASQGAATAVAQTAQQAAAQASPTPAFGRPSERPNEPVTSGAAMGPGPGVEALPPAAQAGTPPATPPAPATGAMTQLLRGFSGGDATGVIAGLLGSAMQFGV